MASGNESQAKGRGSEKRGELHGEGAEKTLRRLLWTGDGQVMRTGEAG